MAPLSITCEDHEGGGKVLIQQWNGTTWEPTGYVIAPMRAYVRKMVVESADKYAKEKGIKLRDCSDWKPFK